MKSENPTGQVGSSVAHDAVAGVLDAGNSTIIPFQIKLKTAIRERSGRKVRTLFKRGRAGRKGGWHA